MRRRSLRLRWRYDRPAIPFVVAFDLPGSSAQIGPLPLIETSIINPTPTLLLLDGIGLDGAPDLRYVSDSEGAFDMTLLLPGSPGAPFNIVSQLYALDGTRFGWGRFHISDAATFTF